MGLVAPPVVQHETMDERLRVRLHNRVAADVCLVDRSTPAGALRVTPIGQQIWDRFFGANVHTLDPSRVPRQFEQFFLEGAWNQVLDLLEIILTLVPKPRAQTFADHWNQVLEAEHSAYRLVEGQVLPIADQIELDALMAAAKAAQPFAEVSSHLDKARALLADRENVNHANTIKEAISAVEAVARVITGNASATLGEALKTIKKSEHPFHPTLLSAFSKIYGWTSDEGGIRHAIKEEGTAPDEALATFMVVTCSAFVSYLIRLHTRLQ